MTLKKFKTYRQQARRECERRNKERKVEVRHARIEAIYSREAAPMAARVEY